MIKVKTVEITVRTEDLITVSDAAKELEVARKTIERWIKDGKLLAIKTEHNVYLDRSRIEKLKQAKTQ